MFFFLTCTSTIDGTPVVACVDDTLLGVSKCPPMLFAYCNCCCWLAGIVTCREVDVSRRAAQFQVQPAVKLHLGAPEIRGCKHAHYASPPHLPRLFSLHAG